MKRVIGAAVKVRLRCPTCARSLKPGFLWMSGRDYIRCPDCEGTARLLLVEERVPPPPTRVFLATPEG